MAHKEATDTVPADYLEDFLRLIEYNVDLNINYTLLDYTSCCYKCKRVKGSVALLARLGVQIATGVTCLTALKKRGGRRKKMNTNTYASNVTAAIRKQVERVGLSLNALKTNKLGLIQAHYSCEFVVK